jgi:hypothetical protein
MVRLNKKKKEKNVIQMQDLKDGQIAVVVDKRYPSYCGKIVQRYKDCGVSIGQVSGSGWTGIESNSLEVRILRDGERLTIFNNE